MSMKPYGNKQGELPLPSPRSPKALDDRILAQARHSAPAKQGASPLGWASGLATAAVLVVAVYLVNLTETGTVTNPPVADALQEDESAGAAASSTLTEVATATIQAEPQPKLKLSAQARTEADFAARGGAEEMATAPAAAPAAKDAKAHSPGPDVNKALLRLQALVGAGELQQAENEYAELRRRCAACALPEELDKALMMLPQKAE